MIDSTLSGRVILAKGPYSKLVAGIVSTKPGLTGRRAEAPSPQGIQVPMAMLGIVPTKVISEGGPILPGDLLVSSSVAGYAMKGSDDSKLTGAVIGKAMESLKGASGVIEVLVSLQ